MRIALASLFTALMMAVVLGWSTTPASAGSYTSGHFVLDIDGK